MINRVWSSIGFGVETTHRRPWCGVQRLGSPFQGSSIRILGLMWSVWCLGSRVSGFVLKPRFDGLLVPLVAEGLCQRESVRESE